MESKAIIAENLTKFYGKARGIDGLDLEVAPGDFFGFIGPNGAGKSTTIRTLLGLISPTSGKAQVLGLDIEKKSREILRRVGYLPSGSSFYNGMRVRDILKLSADLRRKNCDAAAAELCERLQLDRSRKVEDLSFGNRKKVGIVCALQHQPELLILDEPTSGLDPVSRDELTEVFLHLRDSGKTVFFSTHITSDLEKCADRILFLQKGELKADMDLNDFRNAWRILECPGPLPEDIRSHAKGICRVRDGYTVLISSGDAGRVPQVSREATLEEIMVHLEREESVL